MAKITVETGDYIKIKKQKVNPLELDYNKWYQVKTIFILNGTTLLNCVFETKQGQEVLACNSNQIKEVMKLNSIEEE